MYIKETHSTSTLLRELYSDNLPHLFTIRTDFQTAGRGQAGNTWESEDGKNLLFSTLMRYPNLPAAQQWRLSMLVAVTLHEVLNLHLPGNDLTIKWPNDIYYGDNKLVGILIENILQGANIAYSIAGVGVNVNQTEWRSNAPNPISMKQITGKEWDVNALLEEWITAVHKWENCPTEEIKRTYMQHLYRQTGWHKYIEREVDIVPTNIAHATEVEGFLAEVVDINEQGLLVLRTSNGETNSYHFKQIRFVL